MLLSFIVGVLVGAVLLRLAPPLWSQLRTHRGPRVLILAAAALATMAVAAGSLYVALGSRFAAASRTTQPLPEHAAAAMGAAASGNAAAAKSMESEVAALAARLARQGGSPEDWALLAQAYDFLGRPDDAQRARAHQASATAGAGLLHLNPETLAAALAAAGSSTAGGAATPAAGTAPARQLEQRVATNPRDGQSWLALADARRSERDYAETRAAYAQAVQLDAMTAQSWADYADTLGSLRNGSLGGEAGRAIDRALALEATNAKALWLKASQLYEEHRYAESLAWWQKLSAVLPADSPDAQIVARNIAEAAALSGHSAPPHAAGTAGAAVVGTVSLDARFAGRVPPDATLFIYVKAADAPGPPLAVMRTSVGSWPISFRLDDSMAMMPSRRLSQFEHVVVEARISRSGQASPAPGDLYVTSGVLRPGTASPLALVIDREIS
jgi:cytochrome c-type biogenesis protein CcmH